MEIKESPVHGKGLFSLEDIPKGSVYWSWEGESKPLIGYDNRPNIVYTREQLEKMEDKKELAKILHGGFYYADADVFIDLNDGTECTNHSDDWNSQIIYDESKNYKKMICVARKAIKAGEEVTAYYGNYMSTEAKWVNDLMLKHNPSRKILEDKVEKDGNKSKNWQVE